MSLSEQYIVTKWINANGVTQCPTMRAKGSQRRPRSIKRRAFLVQE